MATPCETSTISPEPPRAPETMPAVERARRARRALDLGLNVLTVPPFGADPPPPDVRSDGDFLRDVPATYRLDARGLGSVRSLVSAVGDLLGIGPVIGSDAHEQLVELGKRLWESSPAMDGGRATVVLDRPEPSVAPALFGRLRDELWEVPLHWLVVASPDLLVRLDRPPSNAFFAVVLD